DHVVRHLLLSGLRMIEALAIEALAIEALAIEALAIEASEAEPLAEGLVAEGKFLARQIVRGAGAQIHDGGGGMRDGRQVLARDLADRIDAGGTDDHLHFGIGGAGLE